MSVDQEFWTSPRIAGGLLVASIMVVLAGLVVIYVQGNVRGLGAGFQGVAGKGAAAAALRTIYRFSIPGAILQLLGFGLLTIFLREAGDRLLGRIGLLLFAIGVTFWVVELAFRLSVTVWAAETAASNGTPPALFEPLQRWMGTLFFLYMVLAYLATAAYGDALLRTALLPAWVGWATLGAGLFGTVSFVTGLPTLFSIPAGVHLAPLLIGIALLM